MTQAAVKQKPEPDQDRYDVRRKKAVASMTLTLTPDEWRRYDDWQRACRRIGVPITTQERFDFLTDLKQTA